MRAWTSSCRAPSATATLEDMAWFKSRQASDQGSRRGETCHWQTTNAPCCCCTSSGSCVLETISASSRRSASTRNISRLVATFDLSQSLAYGGESLCHLGPSHRALDAAGKPDISTEERAISHRSMLVSANALLEMTYSSSNGSDVWRCHRTTPAAAQHSQLSVQFPGANTIIPGTEQGSSAPQESGQSQPPGDCLAWQEHVTFVPGEIARDHPYPKRRSALDGKNPQWASPPTLRITHRLRSGTLPDRFGPNSRGNAASGFPSV